MKYLKEDAATEGGTKTIDKLLGLEKYLADNGMEILQSTYGYTIEVNGFSVIVVDSENGGDVAVPLPRELDSERFAVINAE